MKKKGQLQAQIFVYVITLIVITLVLIYGYKAIQGFMGRSDEVNFVQFKVDFTNSIESQSHEFRSVAQSRLLLPKGFTELIVIDLDYNSVSALSELEANYPLVYDSWDSGVERNVFVIGKNKFESFYAGNIYFDDASRHYMHLTAPDRVVTLKLTGRGGKTEVEQWT